MKKLFKLILAVAAVTCLNPVTAQSIDELYTLIRPTQPTATPGKVEVIEVFSYACGGCYMFEPVIRKWLDAMPEQAEFVRMPAMFNAGWEPLGKAYYTAEKLGITQTIHPLIFEAIHKDKRQIFDDAAIREFFIENGVDAGEYDRAANSMEVKTQVRKANVMIKKYKVPSTPSIVINGKYLIQPSRIRGDNGLYEVMNTLISREQENL